MESFINREKYKESYGASLKSKQSSFMSRYKIPDAPKKESKDDMLIKAFVAQPDGVFELSDTDGPEEEASCRDFIKRNNPILLEKYGFVIIPIGMRSYEKKILKYE